MAGETPVRRTLRIDNVEAIPAERITANDEERVRQGFDIQTVFSWPVKNGRIDVTEAEFGIGSSPLLSMQYANSAAISRINKGLRRRRDKTVLGFLIDPRTGYWAKTDDEDPDGDLPPDAARPVRIVPIVRDHKNALLFRFIAPEASDLTTVATVQHALMRGIEVEFQLEEGEVLGEPLPQRDNRRAILAYEATEGGAGVLNRLVEDTDALNRVARQALDLMHFECIEEAISAGDAALLQDRQGQTCVRGCYRCLLSYFNQPDHELIDRTNAEAKKFLVDLARGTIAVAHDPTIAATAQDWQSLFTKAGLPATDDSGVTLADTALPFAWRSHCVAATEGEISVEASQSADAKGWTLFQLLSTPDAALPPELIAILKE